jgi:hypothetical protein
VKEKASKSVLERHKSPEQSRLLLQLLFILLRTEASCLDFPFTIHQFVSPVVVVISPECLTSNFAHPDGWRFALKGQGFIITVKPRTRNLPSSIIARVRFILLTIELIGFTGKITAGENGRWAVKFDAPTSIL